MSHTTRHPEAARILREYIEGLNAETAKWVAEAPGRWAGQLVTDPDHWAEYEIFTPSQLEDYFDAEAERDARKEAMQS
jgi:hypothetical protein